jgi:hypothetical protein
MEEERRKEHLFAKHLMEHVLQCGTFKKHIVGILRPYSRLLLAIL